MVTATLENTIQEQQLLWGDTYEKRPNGELYLTGHGANKWTPAKQYWELGESTGETYQTHDTVDAFIAAALGFNAEAYINGGAKELKKVGLPDRFQEEVLQNIKKQAFLQKLAEQYAVNLRMRDEFHTSLVGQTCYTLSCAIIDTLHPADIQIPLKISRTSEQVVIRNIINTLLQEPLFEEFKTNKFFEPLLFPR